MMSLACLTGQSTDHLITLTDNHRLQPAAAQSFLAMQQQALQAGLNLQPASSFRDFSRQLTIWNEKFSGKRPILDENSHPLPVDTLTTEQRCLAILHWSALPGTSRHHWGSDIDIYDPDRLPAGQKLLLEPWEYEPGGYFAELSQWLTKHMADYNFYRPFEHPASSIGYEPWHISYRPIAEHAEQQLTPEQLLLAWQDHDIAGYGWLRANLTMLFERFITPK